MDAPFPPGAAGHPTPDPDLEVSPAVTDAPVNIDEADITEPAVTDELPAHTPEPSEPVNIDQAGTTEPAADDEPPAHTPEPSEPVITEDPDAPVTVDEAGTTEPAATDEPPAHTPEPSEPVITEDPDAPVTVDEAGTTEPAATDEAPAHTPEPSEPVITEDPDAPVTVDQAGTTEPAATDEAPTASPEPSEPVITDDPDAPVTVDQAGTTDDEAEPAADAVLPEQLLMGAEVPADEAAANETRLLALLEAAVYVTDEPLTLEQIARAVNLDQNTVRAALDKLVEEFNKPIHGLTVREVAGGFKMATKPEHHEAVRTFVKNLNPPLKLSLAALETLAVIAYKQPITAPEIMEIRGVQGAGVLKTLIDRKLITTAGRKNVVGKPILYKTTREFLVQFGLRDLNELPTLREFDDLRRMALTDDVAPADSVGPEDTTQDDTRDPAGEVQQPEPQTE